MAKRLTVEDFIIRAKSVHGDKYDYSLSNYISKDKKLKIICPIHGVFEQSPNNHWKGKGCPYCSGNKKLTQDEFITKSNDVHHGFYDYTNVVYVNVDTPVKILCKEHGFFEQTPYHHLQGRGCPICGRTKMEQTNLSKYGSVSPFGSSNVQEKVATTNLERYGVENVFALPEFQEKAAQTNMERYGNRHAASSDEIRGKIVETMQSRFGGNTSFSSKEIKEKAERTIEKLYGCRSAFGSEEIQERIKQTNLKRYGVPYSSMNPDIYAKSVDTNLERYGVSNPMKCNEIVNKVFESRRKNQTFSTSEPEELLYEALCGVFDENDIVRQYKDEKYPFACDFYIKSRNLYIELNASWVHGGHPYGMYKYDSDVLSAWSAKDSMYYKNAISVWTSKDVNKRNIARKNNLNYIVFWDNELRDAAVWFSMNCPDGGDYDIMYSWLPDRKFDNVVSLPLHVTGSSSNLSQIAKHYQCDVFYHQELRLWHENPMYRGLCLQMYLYHNRLIYLKKNPVGLTDFEILRGFTIAGIHKGYTVFNSNLMQQCLQKYNIKSVYDPCAGWGERMLCCYYNHVKYLGIDINMMLKSGYNEMMNDFLINNQSILFNDSATCDLLLYDDVDAVITCPPYGSTELYTDVGAENLSRNDFIDWWRHVVLNSLHLHPMYFCFQINQKWRDEMLYVVASFGFELIDELFFTYNQSSHFTREASGVNRKQEKETMVVMRRIS